MKRQALGKGLDALLPAALNDGTPASADIDLLAPNPRQPRYRFQQEPLEELAASIREHGIIQPIVVRRMGDRYEIIAGERRWRAAQLAGLHKVPIVVLDVPDEQVLELALLENIQRENLNPVEEARAYRLLLDEQGLRQEDLAQRLGKARTTIANSLRLLNLSQGVQERIENGLLTAGQARPILSVEDTRMQEQLADTVVKKGLSAREVEKLVARMAREKSQPVREEPTRDPNLMAAEEKLSLKLGARVCIEPAGGRGGRIVIHYTSEEELDRLYDELNQLQR